MTTTWPTPPGPVRGVEPAPGTLARDGQTRRTSPFAIIFGAVAVVVTLGAIVLAALAPSLETAAPPAVPSGWTQAYNADLNGSTTGFETGAGCAVTDKGLDVTADQSAVTCTYQPSDQGSLLANGFQLRVTMAPASQIAGGQQPLIGLGDSAFVAVEQVDTATTFVICNVDCTAGADPVQLGSDAWHGEGYYANTLTLFWGGTGQQLVVSANGQQVASVDFHFASGAQGLELGTLKHGEALYSHMTLDTAP